MRVLSLLPTVCALTLLASSSLLVADASNIDTDGFTMDGSATYCQGVKGGNAGGAVSLPNLVTNSLNRCPILVKVTSSATTVHQNEGFDVTWKANAKFGDIAGNIFPNAVNQGTKTPQNVVGSYIKACKAGTNCGNVLDGTPTGAAELATGGFDGTGAKTLRGYRFTFPEQGEYILVGKVTLPGDPALDVSASEFIAFQKITVVDPKTSIAPSPSPTTPTPTTQTPTKNATATATPTPTNGTSSSNNSTVKPSTDEAGTVGPSGQDKTSAPSTSDEIPSDNKSTTTGTTGASEDKDFFASHGVLLAAVAGGCIAIFMLGYVVSMRRKKQAIATHKTDGRRMQTTTVSRTHHTGNDLDDDPEPGHYISKKTARSNDHSVPIMSRPSVDSADGIIDMSKRGSEMELSFDEDQPQSFDEGTVTASNKAVSALPTESHDPRPSSLAPQPTTANKVVLTTLYTEDHSNNNNKNKDDNAKQPPVPRESEQERAFYKSEAWQPGETARPYHDIAREQSTISFTEEDEVDSSRSGFEAVSFNSIGGDSMFDMEEQRHTRFDSEASVDSYAFRPSSNSIAESYASRVSRYSLDSEMDRESSRISGMSMYSTRDTDVSNV